MKHTHAIACYVASVIALMFFAIVLNSCNTLRHYKKVAKDAPRSEAKRDILASVCAVEFPVKNSVDSTVAIEYVADTTNEARLKKIIKQLAAQLSSRPECPQVDEDSLLIELKKSIKPDTVKITTKVKETKFDSAAFKTLQLQTDKHLENAQLKYDELGKAFEKSEANFYKANARVKQLEAGTKSNLQLAKWFLKINWWWLLITLGLFIGYRYLKANYTLPKIF